MNRYALWTLAAVALSIFLRVSAAAQNAVFARCDKPIADAEVMAKAVAECYDVMVASRAALERQAKPPAPTMEYVTASAEPVRTHLLEYYTYSAFGSGDTTLCRALASMKMDKDCVNTVHNIQFHRAQLGTDAELLATCKTTASEGGGQTQCCDQLLRNRALPDLCAKMVPGCLSASECRAFVASTMGDASACRALPVPKEDCKGEQCLGLYTEAVAICEGTAAYAQAVKAKNPSLCGGSQICRVMSGAGKEVALEIAAKHLRGPAASAFLASGGRTTSAVVVSSALTKASAPPTAAPASASYKGFNCAEPMFSTGSYHAATSVVNSARSCVSDIEAVATPSRELADATDERVEKLVRLSLRIEKSFGVGVRAKPVKAPAKAPK